MKKVLFLLGTFLLINAHIATLTATGSQDFSSPTPQHPSAKLDLHSQLEEFEKTTVNFVWINPKVGDMPKVYRRGDEDLYLFQRIKEWAETSAFPVILWVDSFSLNEDGKETLAQEISALKNQGLAVSWKDIRDIPRLSERCEDFNQKPFYCRVDLAKMLLSLYLLETDPNLACAVFTDFSLKALDPETLFDPPTKNSLRDCGLVMAQEYQSETNAENGFHMLGRNKDMWEAIDLAIIQRTLNTQEKSGGFVWHCLKPLMDTYCAIKGIPFEHKACLGDDWKEIQKNPTIVNTKEQLFQALSAKIYIPFEAKVLPVKCLPGFPQSISIGCLKGEN